MADVLPPSFRGVPEARTRNPVTSRRACIWIPDSRCAASGMTKKAVRELLAKHGIKH